MEDVYAINRIHFAKRDEWDNVSTPFLLLLTLRLRQNKVDVIPVVVVNVSKMRIGGGAEQQRVSKCKGLPSEK